MECQHMRAEEWRDKSYRNPSTNTAIRAVIREHHCRILAPPPAASRCVMVLVPLGCAIGNQGTAQLLVASSAASAARVPVCSFEVQHQCPSVQLLPGQAACAAGILLAPSSSAGLPAPHAATEAPDPPLPCTSLVPPLNVPLPSQTQVRTAWAIWCCHSALIVRGCVPAPCLACGLIMHRFLDSMPPGIWHSILLLPRFQLDRDQRAAGIREQRERKRGDGGSSGEAGRPRRAALPQGTKEPSRPRPRAVMHDMDHR